MRGWLMIGTGPNFALPPSRWCGRADGDLPEAVTYPVGAWLYWTPEGARRPLVLVCVELPL